VLISAGYNPILNNYYALFTAAENDNSNIVQLILTNIKVNELILNELLLESVRNNSIKVVELLLIYPNINPHINDNQLIILSASFGFNEIVHLLIKYGVDPSLPNNNALYEAVKNNHYLTVKELLKDIRINPSISNNELIKISIRLNYISIFEVLINDSRVDVSKNNNELIILAASLGRNKHIEDLLKLNSDAGVDPSANNNMALMEAVSNDHYDTVKELLTDIRVDPYAQNNQAIIMANKKGYLSIADLLKYGRIEQTRDKYKILDKMTIFKNKVKDTLGGLVAGYYIGNSSEILKGNDWVTSLYDYPESIETTSNNMFSYNFTIELITNQTSLVPKIHTIEYLLEQWPDAKHSVNNAVSSILDPNKILLNPTDDLYGGLRGFLLLCFRPQYTFIEIMNILKKEGNNKEALRLAGKFIGAYLGLNKLVDQGLEIDNILNKYINKIIFRDIVPLMMQSESATHQS
jgi:hypothetical protein